MYQFVLFITELLTTTQDKAPLDYTSSVLNTVA